MFRELQPAKRTPWQTVEEPKSKGLPPAPAPKQAAAVSGSKGLPAFQKPLADTLRKSATGIAPVTQLPPRGPVPFPGQGLGLGRGSELPPQNKSPTPAASAKKTTPRDPNTGEPLVHYMPVPGYNGQDEHYPHAKTGDETAALNDWVWSVEDEDEKKARYAAVAKALKYCRFRCREVYRKCKGLPLVPPYK